MFLQNLLLNMTTGLRAVKQKISLPLFRFEDVDQQKTNCEFLLGLPKNESLDIPINGCENILVC